MNNISSKETVEKWWFISGGNKFDYPEFMSYYKQDPEGVLSMALMFDLHNSNNLGAEMINSWIKEGKMFSMMDSSKVSLKELHLDNPESFNEVYLKFEEKVSNEFDSKFEKIGPLTEPLNGPTIGGK